MTNTFNIDPKALDDLFPSESDAATTPQNTDAQLTPAAPQVAATPVPEEVYLKSSSGTVYKTREAAEQGVAQKDALIEQWRQEKILQTGFDPVTKKPVRFTQPQERQSYQENPNKYTDDLKAATTPEQLANVQTQFIMDALAPMQPAIAAATRNQALTRIEAEVPGFNTFYHSTAYSTTLDAVPSLKEAVEAAEADVRFHNRLPELYKVVHLVSQGIQLPELLKQAKPATQPLTPQRPTNIPSTPTPTETTNLGPVLSSSEARKRFIEAFEKANTGALNW